MTGSRNKQVIRKIPRSQKNEFILSHAQLTLHVSLNEYDLNG